MDVNTVMIQYYAVIAALGMLSDINKYLEAPRMLESHVSISACTVC